MSGSRDTSSSRRDGRARSTMSRVRVESSTSVPETPPTESSAGEDEEEEIPSSQPEVTGSDAASGSNLDGRFTFYRAIDGQLDHKKISSTCYRTFKRIPNPTGFSWKLTPDHIIAKFFDEFRKFYTWPPELETEVYTMWEARAKTRYSGWLSDMKKKKSKGKPKWLNNEMWTGLLEYWKLPGVVDKSDKARSNRLSQPDGPGSGISKHRCGSKSVRRRVHEMATEKGVLPTQVVYETFRTIHVNKDGTYLTSKDAKIDAKVNELVAQEGEGADINKIYLQVQESMQNVKRPRVYSMGSLGTSLLSQGSRDSGSILSQFQSHEQCESRIMSLEEQAREDRRQREELQAQILATQQMMKDFMATQLSRQQNDHSDAHSS